jgi:recombination protein RecA
VTVKKNKVAAPLKEAQFDILFAHPLEDGVSILGELIDMAVKKEILQKRGAYLSYGDSFSVQGRDKLKQYLYRNQDKAYDIHCRIFESFGLLKPNRVYYGKENISADNIEGLETVADGD